MRLRVLLTAHRGNLLRRQIGADLAGRADVDAAPVVGAPALRTHGKTVDRASLAVFALIALAGCDLALSTPHVEIRGGVPRLTAADVERLTLSQIRDDERALGRVLAPARVVRMVFVGVGETIQVRRADGRAVDDAVLGPTDSPSWIVEAFGTFAGGVPGDPAMIGMHAYIVFRDDSGEYVDRRFIPCWADPAIGLRADDLEGNCAPPQ